MRLSILLGRLPGAELAVIVGPADPVAVNAAYKAAVLAPEYVEIQLWESHGGLKKRKTFSSGEILNTKKNETGDTGQSAASLSAVAEVPAVTEQTVAAGLAGLDDDGPSLGSTEEDMAPGRKGRNAR